MTQLETHTLKAFIAVAEHRSFSKAAQELHITQPAMSKRVAQLENQLGAQLFERLRKQVFLTEAGRTLLPRARSILQSMEDALRTVRDLDGQVSGELSIAFSHHIGLHRLPPFLKTYSRLYPDVRLNIDFVDSDKAYDKILNGDIELAVITLSPDTHPDVLSTTLWRDPLAFMCSPDHALHLKNDVSLRELSEMSVILPGSGTHTGRLVAETFAREHLLLHSPMTTNYLETIKMMVSIGLGWSVLPKTMKDSLEIIHVPDVYMERKLGTIAYKGRKLSNAAETFKALLLASKISP
jgi:DNA-binding transcriptional LysR family regulator